MATVGQLKTKISMDSAQFEQSMAGVNRQLKGLQQESKAATSAGTGFARGVTELRSKSDILTRTLDLQQVKVAELKRRYDESKVANGENTKATQDASTAYNKALAEMNKTEEQLRRVAEELRRQEDPWRVAGENMERIGTKMQSTGKQMTAFGRNMTMRVTAPLVGMGALMLKTGMDFEASMSNVQAVSGATGSDLEQLEAKAREMGATTTKSASDAADALGYMALAGWETQEMLDGLEPILRLSEAANIDLGRASDLTTDSMSALGIEVKDLPQYLDAVSEASRESNTSIDGLMEAYVTAGGNLNQFNVPLEESTALLGLLANRGIKGTQAGRGLNAIMVNLTSGAGQAGVAMEELELSAFDAEGQFIGLEETLRLVKDATEDMTDEQKAQYISMIAGKEHMKTFQGLLAGLDDEYDELKASIEDSDGALNEMADTMQDNAKGSIEQLKSAFGELSIQFSQHVLPAFTELVDKATDAVNWFGNLEEGTQENIIKMGAFAAAIGPVLVVMGTLITSLGTIVKTLGTASIAIAGKGGLVASLGLLTTPIGLAITSVGLLAGGIYLWNQHANKTADINLDVANSLLEQRDSLEEVTERYDELRRRSGLTTDQIGELIDIQHRMENESDPEKLEDLQKAYDQIAEATRLSEEEIQDLLTANNQIIEQTPAVETTFTERGNAVVESTDAVHDYIATLDEMVMKELELERAKFMQQRKEIMEELEAGQRRLIELEEESNQLLAIDKMEREEIDDRIVEINEKLADGNTTTAEANALNAEQEMLIKAQNGGLADQIQALQDEAAVIRDNVTLSEEQLKKIIEIDSAIAGIHLKTIGINETGQEGLDLANESLDKHKEERDAIQLEIDKNGDKNGALQLNLDAKNEEISKHEEVIRKIQEETELTVGLTSKEKDKQSQLAETWTAHNKIRRELEDTNKEAGKDVNKNVNVSDGGDVARINRELAKTISKKVNLTAHGTTAAVRLPTYAKGTDSHPGGAFIAGEEGYELGRMNNNWEVLKGGLYDRPSGYQVFTHDESKNILRSLNNMPAYATGARPEGEARRIVGMNQQLPQMTGEAVIYTTVINQMNGREISRETHKHITEFQERDKGRRKSFA